MPIDFSALLYDPVYAEIGVPAEFIAGDIEASLTVIDDTRPKALPSGSAEVRSVGPGAFARIPELEEKGITRDDWQDASLSFNGRSWVVRSYELRGSPNGEDFGEVRFLLKQAPEPDVTAPTITSATTFSTPENTTKNHTLTASETVTWAIIGGADAAQFDLAGSTLTMAPQDYEAGTTLVVTVQATDLAGNQTSQTITATVTNVDETTSTTVVAQGAMSGGGYIQTIDIADDGTVVITYDGNNCYIKDAGATQWENLLHQDRFPVGSPHGVWGQGKVDGVLGCHSPVVAVAPSDSDYLYMVVKTRVGAFSKIHTKLWRRTTSASNWRWEETGFSIGLDVMHKRGQGPTMKVDPANPLHVLVSDDAGAIWRTVDGFDTITCLNAAGGPLASVLPSAVTTGNTATDGTVLTFGSGTIPATVTTPTTYYTHFVYMSNVSDNSAFGVTARVLSTTSTTVTTEAEGLTGTGTQTGDKIVFGQRAGIAFDRSSAVTGGITQGVYIGWGYGPTAIWRSTNGCTSFSAVSGSPPRSLHLTCSHDGVLYVLPFEGTTDGGKFSAQKANTPRRYQSGTWTNLGHSSYDDNPWSGVAADPADAGRVVFLLASGNVGASGNYGATITTILTSYDANYNLEGMPRTDTECPAMGAFAIPDGVTLQGTLNNSMSHGQCMFDPTVAGKLWITDGIGIWTCSPPESGTNIIVPMTGFNKNAQSIILNQLIKPPGRPLIASSQDRGGYRFPGGPTVEPTGDFGLYTGPLDPLHHGWGIDYAKDDPDFLILALTGGCKVSTDNGLLWTANTTDAGYQTAVACQTSQNFVLFPNGTSPLFTTNGGTTTTNCLFAGNVIVSGWAAYFGNRKMVCADLVDADTYYAYNYNGADAGTWRSTDGGANWVKMGGPVPHPTNPGLTFVSASTDFQLTAVAGYEGHLLIGPGSAYNFEFPVMFSKDAGATWDAVGGTGVAWLAAFGKEAPSKSYPALYYAGKCTSDAAPTDPGMFVTIDFDPDDPTADPGWERLSRAPGGNTDTAKHLFADTETFGSWYMSMGGTGYVYGAAT